jgi:hypothetical protein
VQFGFLNISDMWLVELMDVEYLHKEDWLYFNI